MEFKDILTIIGISITFAGLINVILYQLVFLPKFNKAFKRIFLLVVITVYSACGGAGCESRLPDTEHLAEAIEQELVQAKVPGASVALIKNNRFLWQENFGFASLEDERAVQEDTSFHLASISKTVVAVALMQLWEQGIFELDEDINNKMPFTVRNPQWQDTPITYRQLMTHTSSISDNVDTAISLYTFGEGPIMSLSDLIEAYFSVEGTLYQEEGNFSSSAPGTEWLYSNYGTALAGYLVQLHSGMDFEEYCQENIFQPLGMSNTSWYWMKLSLSKLAVPYYFEDGQFFPIGHYSYPDYPSGSIHATASDLGKFLMMIAGKGSLNCVRILDEKTVEEIMKVQYPEIAPDQGLFWSYAETSYGMLFGHTGGEMGAATQMFFRPKDGVGTIVLANGDWIEGPETTALYRVTELLFGAVK